MLENESAETLCKQHQKYNKEIQWYEQFLVCYNRVLVIKVLECEFLMVYM